MESKNEFPLASYTEIKNLVAATDQLLKLPYVSPLSTRTYDHRNMTV